MIRRLADLHSCPIHTAWNERSEWPRIPFQTVAHGTRLRSAGVPLFAVETTRPFSAMHHDCKQCEARGVPSHPVDGMSQHKAASDQVTRFPRTAVAARGGAGPGFRTSEPADARLRRAGDATFGDRSEAIGRQCQIGNGAGIQLHQPASGRDNCLGSFAPGHRSPGRTAADAVELSQTLWFMVILRCAAM